MGIRKVFGMLCLALALIGFVGGISIAAPIQPGQGILIIDGADSGDGVVIPDITAFSIPPTIEIGQVVGGVFSVIVDELTPLTAGSVVDFAVRFMGNVHSLTNPNNAVVEGDLTSSIPASDAGTPSPLSSEYFNTLNLRWELPGFGVASFQAFNAGSNNDGFQAVPIPAAVLLFGTGLAGLVGIARRKVLLNKK